MEFLNEKELPYSFHYPDSLKKSWVLNLVNFCPWWMLDRDGMILHLSLLRKEYPKRKLIPFAMRQDNDDIACFEVGKGETVLIIHLGASEGWEQQRTYPDFEEWLKVVIEDMRDATVEDCIHFLPEIRKNK